MQRKPTHATVAHFISTLIPSKANDVQYLYHVPRHPKYDPNHARVDQIVLSVTPTPGVYNLIEYRPIEAENHANTRRKPRSICFLHRPFALERRCVQRGNLVLASHTSFDEVLTVGWNVVLAERLGVNKEESLCMQGYKGDMARKIGIVGKADMPIGLAQRRIVEEFGGLEYLRKGSSDQIQVIAIMNAFNAEQVHHVLDMAQERGWIPAGEQRGRHVLYLTGQPRETGLLAAGERGVSVACVGHRAAEDWGIRYLAGRLRSAFPSVRVKEIYEEELPIEPKLDEVTTEKRIQ